MDKAYLDNNATAPLLPEAFEAMRPFFFEKFGNASSLYERGHQAHLALEQARGRVARLLGASPQEIVFTSGGTEGDTMAILGLVSPGDHVITTAIEHHAVLHSCERAEALGAQVTRVEIGGDGQVNPDDVRAALRPNTRLISVMMANNETGVVQPVEAIGRIAAEADVLFHTDAVQAAGKLPIDVARIQCHLLTLSGHKLHAPLGVGALYVRKGTLLRPLLQGGAQEHGMRAGTENLPGIVGLGVAAELAVEWFVAGKAAKLASLRDRLERTAIAKIEHTRVNGGSAPRVPNTTNLGFEGIAGKSLVVALDLKGICASTGSACSAGSSAPPYVLMAMGLSAEQAYGAVRFSLGKQTTEQEIDHVLECLPDAVAQLRAVSPVWKKQARLRGTSVKEGTAS